MLRAHKLTTTETPSSTHMDDELTVKRDVRIPACAVRRPSSQTTPMPEIDQRLLAIVRGEIDPEEDDDGYDPFGGLLPVGDDDDLSDDPFGGLIVVGDGSPIDDGL